MKMTMISFLISKIWKPLRGLLQTFCYALTRLCIPRKAESHILPIQNSTPIVIQERTAADTNDQLQEEVEVSIDVVVETMVAVAEERWIKHYCSRHKILLVGEGDFSFAASLAVAFCQAPNMIATSLDSEEFLLENYARAATHIAELRWRKCTVLHEIDATNLQSYFILRFDCIVWNFPYAGFFKNKTREAKLRRHRSLLNLFLKNAKEMITETGEIHITHMTRGPFYDDWNLESIASSHGLKLSEAVDFCKWDYPGYQNKYGFGGDNGFDCNPSKTFKFGLNWV